MTYLLSNYLFFVEQIHSPVQFRKYYKHPVLGFTEHSPIEVPSQNALAQDLGSLEALLTLGCWSLYGVMAWTVSPARQDAIGLLPMPYKAF